MDADPQPQGVKVARRNTVFVASAEAVSGRYCENRHISEVTDGLITPISEGLRSYEVDAERARALCSRSEDMVGERY